MAVNAPIYAYVNGLTTGSDGIEIIEHDAPNVLFKPNGTTTHKLYGYKSSDGVTWPSTAYRTQDVTWEANANGEISAIFRLEEAEKYYKIGVTAVDGSAESSMTFTQVFFYKNPVTAVGKPKNVKLAETVSRETVELAWDAGTDGNENSVTGYDVQQRDSADASAWGSWTTAEGSPTSGRKLNVSPPDTVGYYRQFRVRTRGSAGSDYYSGYVTSSNTLRRKWDTFGAWEDQTLTPMSTHIRAVHITQIQERIQQIRAFYGIAAFDFTAITPGETKIAGWDTHIQELRDAIDEIAEASGWNTLETGKPRIAHITQLRAVVDAL